VLELRVAGQQQRVVLTTPIDSAHLQLHPKTPQAQHHTPAIPSPTSHSFSFPPSSQQLVRLCVLAQRYGHLQIGSTSSSLSFPIFPFDSPSLFVHLLLNPE
jgi:hypothetical protein